MIHFTNISWLILLQDESSKAEHSTVLCFPFVFIYIAFKQSESWFFLFFLIIFVCVLVFSLLPEIVPKQ